MPELASTSRIVADELRKAENSIAAAMRNTTHFLLTTLDATKAHRLSPAMTQRTVKAAVAALTALVESQDQMTMHAHPSIKRVGLSLGLTETNWGEGAPKPEFATSSVPEAVS